MMPYKGDLKF